MNKLLHIIASVLGVILYIGSIIAGYASTLKLFTHEDSPFQSQEQWLVIAGIVCGIGFVWLAISGLFAITIQLIIAKASIAHANHMYAVNHAHTSVSNTRHTPLSRRGKTSQSRIPWHLLSSLLLYGLMWWPYIVQLIRTESQVTVSYVLTSFSAAFAPLGIAYIAAVSFAMLAPLVVRDQHTSLMDVLAGRVLLVPLFGSTAVLCVTALFVEVQAHDLVPWHTAWSIVIYLCVAATAVQQGLHLYQRLEQLEERHILFALWGMSPTHSNANSNRHGMKPQQRGALGRTREQNAWNTDADTYQS